MATSLQELQNLTFFPVTIPVFDTPVTFTCRRLDIETVLWEGVITEEMAAAADRFLALQQMLAKDESDIEVGRKVLATMTAQDKDLLMRFLHGFVRAKVVEPRMAIGQQEGAFDVTKLSFVTLTLLFAALPPTQSASEIEIPQPSARGESEAAPEPVQEPAAPDVLSV